MIALGRYHRALVGCLDLLYIGSCLICPFERWEVGRLFDETCLVGQWLVGQEFRLGKRVDRGVEVVSQWFSSLRAAVQVFPLQEALILFQSASQSLCTMEVNKTNQLVDAQLALAASFAPLPATSRVPLLILSPYDCVPPLLLSSLLLRFVQLDPHQSLLPEM